MTENSSGLEVFNTQSKTTYNNIFATIVTTIRKEKKLSQKEVAEKLGLTVAAISKLESGGTQITFDHVYALAYALNIKPTDLFKTLEIGVEGFIEGGGVLVNNFYKDENQKLVVDPFKTDAVKPFLAAVTLSTGGAGMVSGSALGGSLLLGALGSFFIRQLSKVINESKNNN